MALKSRTLVATPAYRGDVVMQYAHCIVRDAVLAMVGGHFVEAPHFINDTYIHAARNRAAMTFLSGDWDYLMFIDADMGWAPDALGRILSMPRDMDIVGGVYRTKEEPPRYPINLLHGHPLTFPVCEIAGVATGFMRVTRRCLQTMLRAHQNGRFFDHIVDDRNTEWGDDIAFCQRARALGCRVWGVFDIEFEHVGPKAYKGTASADLAKSEGYLLPATEIVDATASRLPIPMRQSA